jgi:hypothetical protein
MHANVGIKACRKAKKKGTRGNESIQKWLVESSVKWTRKHQGRMQQHAYVEMETSF